MTKYILVMAVTVIASVGTRLITIGLGLDPYVSGFATGWISMMVYFNFLHLMERIEND